MMSKTVLEIFLLAIYLLFVSGQSVEHGTNQSEYIRPANSTDISLNSPLLKPKVEHDPEQIHLALAGEGRLAISWVTHPTDDEELKKEVLFEQVHSIAPERAPWENYSLLELNSTDDGLSQKKYKKNRCKHLKDYPLEPMAAYWTEDQDVQDEAYGHYSCYASSSYFSGALSTVIIGTEEPLKANTQYFYRVGDQAHGWSKTMNFTMVPDVGPQSMPYRLGLIGDLGQTEDSAKTLKHLNSLNAVTVLNVGDLSYADGYQPRWDSWGRLLEDHASRIPWMHIEGNHELEDIDGETGFVAYEERFYYPAIESGSNSPFYYSYETGPAHVIMLGCYVAYSATSAQADWLKKDLASVDRERTPWLVVGMHAPWYNSNWAHQGEVEDMRSALEPILFKYQVDVVFAGHVHAYERSNGGVYDGKLSDCGPTYIVIGDGGNREGLATSYMDKPKWSDVREASFGMGILEFQNSTHAIWQWHRNQDHTTKVADEFWLTKSSECIKQPEAKPKKPGTTEVVLTKSKSKDSEPHPERPEKQSSKLSSLQKEKTDLSRVSG